MVLKGIRGPYIRRFDNSSYDLTVDGALVRACCRLEQLGGSLQGVLVPRSLTRKKDSEMENRDAQITCW